MFISHNRAAAEGSRSYTDYRQTQTDRQTDMTAEAADAVTGRNDVITTR